MASGDGLVEVLVEYEYVAEQDDELSLKPGDIVTEVEKLDGGWWEGSLGGKRGVFPDNFVKEITKKTTKSEKKKVAKLAPPPVGKGTKRSRRAKVTYSYVAENPDEVSLKVGDVVEILNQEEEGWWEGIVDGKQGLFPSNFVELISDEAPKSEENDFQEIKGKKIKGVGFGDIFAGGVPKLKPKKQGSTDSELASPPIINSQSNHRPPIAASRREESPPSRVKESPPSKQVERARVLYPYNAENEDELNLEEGDIVNILEKELEDSGWWKGSVRGKVGVFPDNFVELIPAEEKPQRPAPPMPSKGRPVPITEPEKTELIKDEKNKPPQKDIPKKTGHPPPPVGQKPGKKPDSTITTTKLLTQTDDHKVQAKEAETTDTNSGMPKLKHLTKDRPKPPSTKQPTAKPATQKELPSRTIPPHHVATHEAENDSTSPRSHHSPMRENKELPKSKPVVTAAAPPAAVSSTELADLRRELQELKANTVSKQKYEELQEETKQLKTQLDELNTKFERRLYNIMCEVDEEKKIRMASQIEVERIKKLVAPS